MQIWYPWRQFQRNLRYTREKKALKIVKQHKFWYQWKTISYHFENEFARKRTYINISYQIFNTKMISYQNFNSKIKVITELICIYAYIYKEKLFWIHWKRKALRKLWSNASLISVEAISMQFKICYIYIYIYIYIYKKNYYWKHFGKWLQNHNSIL